MATSKLASDFANPRVQVEAPFTVLEPAMELVCMEMNKSALALLAISALFINGTKTSLLRVKITSTSGCLSLMSFPSFNETFKLMSFSLDTFPTAPGS